MRPLFLLIILFSAAKINRLHSNARLDFLRQPLCEQCIAAARAIIAYGGKECRAVTDEDNPLLRACYGGVEQVPLEHNVMRTHEREDDDVVLTALTLVHAHRVGKGECTELVPRIGNLHILCKCDNEVLRIDLDNASDVAAASSLCTAISVA